MPDRPEHSESPSGPVPGDDDAKALTVIQDQGDVTDHEERIDALVESDASPEEVARRVGDLDAPDAADTLERLEPEDSVEVIERMGDESAAEALSHMQLPIALTLFADFSDEEAARYLALMEPDDAADLLQELPNDRARALLEKLPADLARLAQFDPETAGGLMTTDFVSVPAAGSVADAIELIRERPDEVIKDFVYCVNEDGVLEGVVALRDLLLASPSQTVEELMHRDVDALRPDVDQEAVAEVFDRYDYFTLPVIDSDNRLLGVITIDDVVDIIRAEHTEDTYKQVGAGRGEAVYSPIGTKLRSRLPWMLFNLLTASFAAIVVLQFTHLIAEIAILAVLMPVIANEAGNAGQQSLAVTLRGLVLGDVSKERVAPLLLREMTLGLLAGLATGAALAVVIVLLSGLGAIETDPRIGLIAMIAMTGALGFGCLIGAGIPILMDRIGFDPATASTIFLTMLTDTTSFATFLGLASLLQHWLLTAPPV